jgi:hypothetical protein
MKRANPAFYWCIFWASRTDTVLTDFRATECTVGNHDETSWRQECSRERQYLVSTLRKGLEDKNQWRFKENMFACGGATGRNHTTLGQQFLHIEHQLCTLEKAM